MRQYWTWLLYCIWGGSRGGSGGSFKSPELKWKGLNTSSFWQKTFWYIANKDYNMSTFEKRLSWWKGKKVTLMEASLFLVLDALSTHFWGTQERYFSAHSQRCWNKFISVISDVFLISVSICGNFLELSMFKIAKNRGFFKGMKEPTMIL